ncbi:YbaK/EbsC family protein [Vibrio astriarenae]|uniref:YbaK/EbsC family protein n=1 Tax=Vibrio astriarenae TaxID=1481923 RepID=UPI003736EEE2
MNLNEHSPIEVKDYLLSNSIGFIAFEHKAVFTCEEAKAEKIGAKGIEVKNLFLKDKKSRRFYLIVAPEELVIDLKSLGLLLYEKLKFANETDLIEILGLTPGAVSPFGLLNDHQNQVKLILHKSVGESDYVQFHPNINTQTLELTQGEFGKCLTLFGNEFEYLEF